MARSDPRRIALLLAIVGGAVGYAWAVADDGVDDVLRFLAGVGAGLVVGGMTRVGDGMLAARMSFGRRVAMANAAIVGMAVIVPGALLLLRGVSVADNVEILLSGAAAGLFAAVGVLYPLDR